MEQQWESHRDEIIDLYITKNWTLKQVMKRMEEAHGFRARYAVKVMSRPTIDS